MVTSNKITLETETKLSQLKIGCTGTVSALHLEGLLRRRMMDLGIIPGTAVECIRQGPSGDPTAYMVRGTTIALRREDADKINVFPI